MERWIFITILFFIVVTVSGSTTKPKNNVHCQKQLCLPKCCQIGTYLIPLKKKCVPKPKIRPSYEKVPLYLDNLAPSGRFLTNFTWIEPAMLSNETFFNSSFDMGLSRNPPKYFLTEEGILYTKTSNSDNNAPVKHNKDQYCVGYALVKPKSGTPDRVRFITYTFHKVEGQRPISPVIGIGMLVSVIFLFLVLIVYTILPELRNLNGKVLMAYVFSLMNAFLFFYVLQNIQLEKTVCKIMTYFIYFLFLASFCWMNIMSCDIWWTFRGYAKARPIHRRGENFKFAMYCIYAWGLPTALTVILIVLNEMDLNHLPWIIQPHITHRSQFIDGFEKFLYLYIPMLILISCNWVFFLMTAFNIWRLHRATAVLDSAAAGTPGAHRSHKYRFLVYLKLSVIMGINWVLEVAASFYPEFIGWYVTDVYNVFIGLSIFLILVCKPKIFRRLENRFRGLNNWTQTRPWYSRSRQASTTTTESEVSGDGDMPAVCVNPKGTDFID